MHCFEITMPVTRRIYFESDADNTIRDCENHGKYLTALEVEAFSEFCNLTGAEFIFPFDCKLNRHKTPHSEINYISIDGSVRTDFFE
tara:strand:+ start:163 stop:423 length:261 start_codon:yes stop_codon:yes gene_type:complete